MGIKDLISRKKKQANRRKADIKEHKEVGSVTDDKLRREIGSLVSDLKMVDANYVKFVKRYSRFGKDGGKSEYNKQMLEKARTERVRSQIQRYQEAMRGGVSGMAIARVVGHVAINAVFNKQFRNDFLDEFRKPLEKTAEKLMKSGGQASLTGKLLRDGTHVPFDARSAALTELAQTLKFNEDMRNTKDPAKREWLTKSYTESLNALYDWAREDGVSSDSIRRMRNVIIDKDSHSKKPKFAHLYEGMEHMERDSHRVEFFEHLDEGVFVWEGDFKDARTGDKFQMIVRAPEFEEPISLDIDRELDEGLDIVSDEKALLDETVAISELDSEGFDFSSEEVMLDTVDIESDSIDTEPVEIVLDWSEYEQRAVPVGSDQSKDITIDFTKPVDDVKMKSERSLEIGTWDDVMRELVSRRIPHDISQDIVEQRFSTTVSKANWERAIEDLTNVNEKPIVKINNPYLFKGEPDVIGSQLRRQAEFLLLDKTYGGFISKSLQVVPENDDVKDGHSRLLFDTDKHSVDVDYIKRERTHRQEKQIYFEEAVGDAKQQAASTKSLTDDELVQKLKLSMAGAGVGASLEEDIQDDYQVGG